MAAVLSQNEIDELLNSLATGDADPAPQESEKERVHVYDFKLADIIPKDQIRALHIIFETFSQLLVSHLMSLLRTTCEIQVVSVAESSFRDFTAALPAPTMLGIMNMYPMIGSQVIEMPPSIFYCMINRLFGGGASGFSEDESDKPFTEIEMAIAERIYKQMCPLMNEAWEKVTGIETTLERLESSSQFAQVVALEEKCAVVMLNVKIDNVDDMMLCCIPQVSLQPVSKLLSSKVWFSTPQDGRKQSYTQVIQKRLIDTEVTISAEFDKTLAQAGDILRLQVGDVIQVNHHVDKNVTVKVGHLPKFHAVMGTHGQNFAIQIVDIIKEDSEYE